VLGAEKHLRQAERGTVTGYRPAVTVSEDRAGGTERARQRRCLVRVTGELGGAVHDAGHLADHDDMGATAVERAQQRERVEAVRVVGVHGARDVVGILVRTAIRGPAGRVCGEAPHGLSQPADRRVIRHGCHSSAVLQRLLVSVPLVAVMAISVRHGDTDLSGLGKLVPAPPVYAPGGPVLLVTRLPAALALAAIERAAAARGATVSVVAVRAGERGDLLEEAGYRRTTDYYEPGDR
jgi:hypothetical protein